MAAQAAQAAQATSFFGKKWEQVEKDALVDEYNTQQLSIADIAKKHDRTTYAIIMRLKTDKLITSEDEARGYQEYLDTAEGKSKIGADARRQTKKENDDKAKKLAEEMQEKLNKLNEDFYALRLKNLELREVIQELKIELGNYKK